MSIRGLRLRTYSLSIVRPGVAAGRTTPDFPSITPNLPSEIAAASGDGAKNGSMRMPPTEAELISMVTPLAGARPPLLLITV